MSDTQTYRVRPGFTHGAGRTHQAGDTLELTEREAAGLLDKLELVSVVVEPTGPTKTGKSSKS
jgi:hypothetical protein